MKKYTLEELFAPNSKILRVAIPLDGNVSRSKPFREKQHQIFRNILDEWMLVSPEEVLKRLNLLQPFMQDELESFLIMLTHSNDYVSKPLVNTFINQMVWHQEYYYFRHQYYNGEIPSNGSDQALRQECFVIASAAYSEYFKYDIPEEWLQEFISKREKLKTAGIRFFNEIALKETVHDRTTMITWRKKLHDYLKTHLILRHDLYMFTEVALARIPKKGKEEKAEQDMVGLVIGDKLKEMDTAGLGTNNMDVPVVCEVVSLSGKRLCPGIFLNTTFVGGDKKKFKSDILDRYDVNYSRCQFECVLETFQGFTKGRKLEHQYKRHTGVVLSCHIQGPYFIFKLALKANVMLFFPPYKSARKTNPFESQILKSAPFAISQSLFNMVPRDRFTVNKISLVELLGAYLEGVGKALAASVSRGEFEVGLWGPTTHKSQAEEFITTVFKPAMYLPIYDPEFFWREIEQRTFNSQYLSRHSFSASKEYPHTVHVGMNRWNGAMMLPDAAAAVPKTAVSKTAEDVAATGPNLEQDLEKVKGDIEIMKKYSELAVVVFQSGGPSFKPGVKKEVKFEERAKLASGRDEERRRSASFNIARSALEAKTAEKAKLERQCASMQRYRKLRQLE